MQHNILITSAGKRVALTRYFKKTLQSFSKSAKVFITDMNPELAPVSYVCDGSFKVPKVTAKEYPEILHRICVENNIGIVIPTIDTELAILALCKKLFSDYGIKVIVSDFDFVQICRDKRKTNLFLKVME